MTLSPEQAAKVARLWVPVAGHLYVNPDDEDGGWWRVLEVFEGQITEMVGEDGWICKPEDMVDFAALAPCYRGDHATSDGLPRTARAAWGDQLMHVRAVVGVAGAAWEYWSPYFSVEKRKFFATETEAWIAAILAAPEAQ